mgnify:CR=1 FL=1
MAFICWWQGWQGRGPDGFGRSIVTPLLCPGREPICVSRDWLVPLGVMGGKENRDELLLMICCGCIVILQQTLLMSSHFYLRSGSNPCLKRQCHLSLLFHRKQHNRRHSVLPISTPKCTISRSVLPYTCMHIFLSIFNRCKEVLSCPITLQRALIINPSCESMCCFVCMA